MNSIRERRPRPRPNTSRSQEVESSHINVEETSKHVVLHHKAPWDWIATSLHAVLAFVEVMIEQLIMVQNAAIGLRPIGVG